MRPINLGVVYPDAFNLNADAANLQIIKHRLELTGYQVKVHAIDSSFSTKASSLDFAVIGSPSSSVLEATMADAKKFKAFASDLIKSDAVVLAVSNGLHAFGSMVSAAGKAQPALELLDFKTTFGKKQHVTIAAAVSTEFGTLIGVENHNATVELGASAKPLGEVSFGTGNNSGSTEGFLKGNFFGTHLHGPILALNESFADELISRIVARAGGTYFPGKKLARLNALSTEARLHLLKRQA